MPEKSTSKRSGISMEITYVKKIIKLLENSSIDEIEIEESGKKLRVARNKSIPVSMPYPMSMPAAYPAAPQAPQPASQPAPLPVAAPSEPAAPPSSEESHHKVLSPIVGTYYKAPSPDADPYVEEGQKVKAGQVLCIVEAMKLMNEIESDVDGTVIKILSDNGKPVEYNQPLFLIDTTS